MTVECKNGDTYRGFLDETEDNMNCILKDATRTDAKGNNTRGREISCACSCGHSEPGRALSLSLLRFAILRRRAREMNRARR